MMHYSVNSNWMTVKGPNSESRWVRLVPGEDYRPGSGLRGRLLLMLCGCEPRVQAAGRSDSVYLLFGIALPQV